MTPVRAVCVIFAFLRCLVCVSSAPDHMFYFGRVLGVDVTAPATGLTYSAYYGIPFAKPPVGDLRFKPPQRFMGSGPVNVISSDSVRTACMQPVFDPAFKMSEDCLYLNVFTPATRQNGQLKKVMVWIHGGGFLFGDNYIYTPSRMVTEEDVIVVTFNYRLGVFGFLSSGNGDGNYGLLDQLSALQWVRDNIGQFGGNPRDVTVYSESAGAFSLSLLTLSPKAQGLFNKVILQSGSCLAPGATRPDPGRQFDKVAKAAGCTPWWYSTWLRSRLLDSVMRCLRRIDDQELLGSSLSLYQPAANPRYGQDFVDTDAAWSPVVDGDVIPRSPATMLSDHDYLREVGTLDRSYILGFNNNEGLYFAESLVMMGGDINSINNPDTAKLHLDDLLKMKFTLGVPEVFESVATYEYLYPMEGGRPPLQGVLDLTSDFTFTVPTVQLARRLKAADNQTKVFMYLFDHNPRVKNASLGMGGSSHALELAYLFDPAPWLSQYDYYTTVPDPSGSDAPLPAILQGSWAAFAKTGSPSTSTPWPQYDVRDESYLAISTRPVVRRHVYAKRMALWTDLFL